MPGIRIDNFGGRGPTYLDFGQHFDPGDQPPAGYLDRAEWAEVQMKAGLHQTRCPQCCLYKFPQELSSVVVIQEAEDSRGRKRRQESRLCNDCERRRQLQ